MDFQLCAWFLVKQPMRLASRLIWTCCKTQTNDPVPKHIEKQSVNDQLDIIVALSIFVGYDREPIALLQIKNYHIRPIPGENVSQQGGPKNLVMIVRDVSSRLSLTTSDVLSQLPNPK